MASGRFAAASVAEIADEAQLSRAAFYFYFASKDALLAVLVDQAVSTFNERIVTVAASEHLSATAAVRATVDAAAQLWWDHADLLAASVQLGTFMPEVYDRTMANIATVRAPTVTLLQRHGTVPEAADAEQANELVTALILMCERTLFDLMRRNPSAADRDLTAARLAAVWLRAFGIAESS